MFKIYLKKYIAIITLISVFSVITTFAETPLQGIGVIGGSSTSSVPAISGSANQSATTPTNSGTTGVGLTPAGRTTSNPFETGAANANSINSTAGVQINQTVQPPTMIGGYVPLEPSAFIGVSSAPDNLGAFLGQIFNWGIAMAIVIALVMMIWGGIEYMTTDSFNGKDDGRKKINQALQGLGLAAVSWLLLFTINPDLVNFTGNTFLQSSPIQTQDGSLSAIQGAEEQNKSIGCINGVVCKPCSGQCVSVTSLGLNCKNGSSCSLNKTFAAKLSSGIAASGLDIRVTEAWPPTVYHLSQCHQDGTCADINLPTGGDVPGNVTDVKKLSDTLKAAGLNPLYETPTKDACTPYTKAGINCASYENAYHFHVNM